MMIKSRDMILVYCREVTVRNTAVHTATVKSFDAKSLNPCSSMSWLPCISTNQP
jgi:hypothetical protein